MDSFVIISDFGHALVACAKGAQKKRKNTVFPLLWNPHMIDSSHWTWGHLFQKSP